MPNQTAPEPWADPKPEPESVTCTPAAPDAGDTLVIALAVAALAAGTMRNGSITLRILRFSTGISLDSTNRTSRIDHTARERMHPRAVASAAENRCSNSSSMHGRWRDVSIRRKHAT